MPTTAKRTSRACERCRHTRRRCEPPYPCRQCVAAGTPCNVRTKARPQRRQRHANSSVKSKITDDCRTRGKRGKRGDNSEFQSGGSAIGDTFELLRALVMDKLFKRHGYILDCTLSEPSASQQKSTESFKSSLNGSNHLHLTFMSSSHSLELLSAFLRFMRWQDAGLLDVHKLHATVVTYSEQLTAFTSSSATISNSAHCLPVDTLALVYVALALGAVAAGENDHSSVYFDISTELVKHFVGPPTLDLCFAQYLQHMFALRIGTSNYAQGIIAQTIHNAHDLGLQHNTCGNRGLKLYLLIYMADQYCSLTHNTKMMIPASNLPGQLFEPLIDAEPRLRTLVHLVTMNGNIIESSHKLKPQSQDEILKLETKISSLSSQQIDFDPTTSSCENFRMAYEPLARVHMLCCRLKLRAPGLSEDASWLPSLCICVHAAESVLLTYLTLYRPMLAALAQQSSVQLICPEKRSLIVASMLPPTWRQVKRIMMSAFVIVLAYWQGEMNHGEASRYMAMARLLLEYPRWRWGEKLDEAIRALEEISDLDDFKLYESMKVLLPEVNQNFPRSISRSSKHGLELSDVVNGTTIENPGAPLESSPAVEAWPDLSDPGLLDDFSLLDSSPFEDHTLLDLWSFVEGSATSLC